MNPIQFRNRFPEFSSADMTVETVPSPLRLSTGKWAVLLEGKRVTEGSVFYCAKWLADLKRLEGVL